MINLYVGRPGFGKTYALVRMAYKKINEGRDIHANFWLDFSSMKLKEGHGKVHFWKTLDDLIEIRHGEILMDEAQIYMNSREYTKLPKEMQYKMQQHRKQGLNLHMAVQNAKRIDTIARELVNSVFELANFRLFFTMKEYDIEDIDKAKRKSKSFTMYFFNKKLAKCYDTLQEIAYSHYMKEAVPSKPHSKIRVRQVN